MKITSTSSEVFQNFYDKGESYKALNKTPPKSDEHFKGKVIAASFIGAVVPVIAINLIKGRGGVLVDTFKKNSNAGIKEKLKAVNNIFEIENYGQILATTAGALTGGFVSGLKFDKNKENREAKYKEGIFEFLNNMIPTTFVALGQTGLDKAGLKNNKAAKAALILSSVAGGMFAANKTSNKINKKAFNDKNHRNFKISDCFVHVDDFINLLVLTRVPFAKHLNVDKLLPFIYAKTGYETGVKKKNDVKE